MLGDDVEVPAGLMCLEIHACRAPPSRTTAQHCGGQPDSGVRGARVGSAEQRGDRDLESWNLSRREAIARSEAPMLLVALHRGLPVHVHHARAKIQNPDLGNAGARVEGHLDFAIVLRRRVGYLNDKEHVPWAGMRTLVIVWTGLQQREVRLRLGVFTQVKLVLDIDNGLLTNRG